jgi:hypothetical protein
MAGHELGNSLCIGFLENVGYVHTRAPGRSDAAHHATFRL